MSMGLFLWSAFPVLSRATDADITQPLGSPKKLGREYYPSSDVANFTDLSDILAHVDEILPRKLDEFSMLSSKGKDKDKDRRVVDEYDKKFASMVRMNAALKLIKENTVDNDSSPVQRVKLMFARDWMIKDKPFRTTWSSGYALQFWYHDLCPEAPKPICSKKAAQKMIQNSDHPITRSETMPAKMTDPSAPARPEKREVREPVASPPVQQAFETPVKVKFPPSPAPPAPLAATWKLPPPSPAPFQSPAPRSSAPESTSPTGLNGGSPCVNGNGHANGNGNGHINGSSLFTSDFSASIRAAATKVGVEQGMKILKGNSPK
mmetsp:Transcript_40252/g.105716  ORF Transcript_40252/g.105716 Transcript_40252/m.105716 type:complete len:320 (-) Transcript_40252:172-1131(-)